MNIDCPIDISVNTNRVFMQGLSGVLELSFRNRSPDEPFDVEVTLASRVFDRPRHLRLTMQPDAERRRTIDLDLTGTSGAAGDTRFEATLCVDAGENGCHRFSGDFILTVLAHAESRGEINVNINKVIEQRGEKAGWGAINEVDLSNLVKLPESVSANSLLSTDRTPRFVSVPLEYDGTVDRDSANGLTSCLLRCHRTGHRLLVYTQPTLILGRSREEADIVTWHLPRSDANDTLTRRISSVQCALVAREDGAWLDHRSTSNATFLNGRQIDHGRVSLLSIHYPSIIRLPGSLEFNVTPISACSNLTAACPPEVAADRAGLWQWCAESRVGGWLIERRDDHADRESYLWLIAGIQATRLSPALLATPSVCAINDDGDVARSSLTNGMSAIETGRVIRGQSTSWIVESPVQCLE